MTTEQEIANLEAKLGAVTIIITKFDDTIMRLNTLTASIDKMLAIQENRLEAYEKQLEIVHKRVYSLKDEYTLKLNQFEKTYKEDNSKLSEKVNNNEKELAKWKWLVTGAFTVAGIIITLIEVATAL